MRNLVQDGLVVPLTAPAPLDAGDVVAIGAIVGIAVTGAPAGTTVQVRLEGVFGDIPGAAGKAAGVPLYWSTDARELTTTKTGNPLAGVSLGNGTVRLGSPV